MDGVILLGCSDADPPIRSMILRRGIPVVALGGPPIDGVLGISLDDEQATGSRPASRRSRPPVGRRGRAPAGATTGTGGGPLDARGRAATAPSRSRSTGCAPPARCSPTLPAVVTAGSQVSEGIVAGHALLDDPARRPTAVIAQSDLLAAGVIKAAEELGLTVPDDLSVVGFDGIALDRIVPHDLTTMAQPAAEQGRAAGRAALVLLDGGHPESARFTSRFHRGGTTAPPRTDEGAPGA